MSFFLSHVLARMASRKVLMNGRILFYLFFPYFGSSGNLVMSLMVPETMPTFHGSSLIFSTNFAGSLMSAPVVVWLTRGQAGPHEAESQYK